LRGDLRERRWSISGRLGSRRLRGPRS
jgi:hypothetical protein